MVRLCVYFACASSLFQKSLGWGNLEDLILSGSIIFQIDFKPTSQMCQMPPGDDPLALCHQCQPQHNSENTWHLVVWDIVLVKVMSWVKMAVRNLAVEHFSTPSL